MAEVEVGQLHAEISGLSDMIGVLQDILQDILQRLNEQRQRPPSIDPERLDRIDQALEALMMAALARPGINLELEEMLVKAAKRLH
jgi:hypothetical protein